MGRNRALIALVAIIGICSFDIATAGTESDSPSPKWTVNLTDGTWASKAYSEGGLPGLCEKIRSAYLLDNENDERFILAYCYYSGISVKQDWNAAIAILKFLSSKSYPSASSKLDQLEYDISRITGSTLETSITTAPKNVSKCINKEGSNDPLKGSSWYVITGNQCFTGCPSELMEFYKESGVPLEVK